MNKAAQKQARDRFILNEKRLNKFSGQFIKRVGLV
jgi:hypothetical protein